MKNNTNACSMDHTVETEFLVDRINSLGKRYMLMGEMFSSQLKGKGNPFPEDFPEVFDAVESTFSLLSWTCPAQLYAAKKDAVLALPDNPANPAELARAMKSYADIVRSCREKALDVLFSNKVLGGSCFRIPTAPAQNAQEPVKTPRRTELMRAATLSDTGPAEKQLEADADPNETDAFGCAPLHAAAYHSDNPDMVRLLLSHKAELEAKSNAGATPLLYSVRNPNPGVLAAFIAEGAKVDAKAQDGETALTLAARYQPKFEITEMLLENGANPDESRDDGCTPLMVALRNGRDARFVSALLAKRADPRIANSFGETALHFAAQYSRDPETIRMLLSAEADVDATTAEGGSALHIAVASNPEFAVLKAVLDAKPTVNAPNRFGQTPLMAAAFFRLEPEVVLALLEAGASPNASDEEGSTPLMFAAQNPNPLVTRALLDAGAKPDARRNDGATAAMIAAECNPHPDVLAMLVEAESRTA